MATPDFKPLQPFELDRLSDDELILHAHRARAAEDLVQARAALGNVIGGRWGYVRSLVLRKVDPSDADELVSQIFEDALKARFDGRSVGEFVNLLKTITSRRIADFVRDGKRKPRPGSLDERYDEDGPGFDVPVEGGEDAVDARDAVERVLAELSDDHRRVVELRVMGYSSKEVCDQVEGMTVANVDQINSRFRKALREALEDAGRRNMDP